MQGLLKGATAAHLLLEGGIPANFQDIPHVGISLAHDVFRVWAKVLPTIDSSQIEFRCYLVLNNWLCGLPSIQRPAVFEKILHACPLPG